MLRILVLRVRQNIGRIKIKTIVNKKSSVAKAVRRLFTL